MKKPRLEYWKNIDSCFSKNSEFNCSFTKSLILPDRFFKPIQALSFELLANSLNSQFTSEEALLDQINSTTSLSLRQNWDIQAKLNIHFINALSELNLLQDISGVEFPVNVRAVHGSAPIGYLDGKYPTDQLHSDIWADEPSDIVNCFLYLGGDLKSTYMELYDCPETLQDKLAEYRGPYSGASNFITQCKKVNYSANPGQFILFDGICPHRTMRTGGKARLSIDFRLRRSDPYEIIDQRWSSGKVHWSKYWYLPNKGDTSFAQRCESELLNLKKGNKVEGLHARTTWIQGTSLNLV